MKPRQCLFVGSGERRARFAPGIGEELERPARGDRRIELAQRAGRGVARIGENRLAGRRALLVQREEPGAFEIDLTADLDHLGPLLARENFRHGVQRAKVRGHILAGGAIAAGCPQHETAGPVGERDRQPVDLGLCHDLDLVFGNQRFGRRAPEEIADPGEEVAHILFFERVLQRQHRPGMGDLGEPGGRGGADPACRAVGSDQLGKPGLDVTVAAAQRVVIGIGNLGRRIGVIKPVVVFDLLRQRGELGPGLVIGERVDRPQLQLLTTPPRGGRRPHARPPAIRLAAAARASAVMLRPDSMRAISSCLVSSSSSSTRVTVWRAARLLATRQW